MKTMNPQNPARILHATTKGRTRCGLVREGAPLWTQVAPDWRWCKRCQAKGPMPQMALDGENRIIRNGDISAFFGPPLTGTVSNTTLMWAV